MRVLIHPRTITAADKELRARVAEAQETALSPVRSRLYWVDVYLTDVNGPKGGPDKRCRVVAHLPTGPVVVVSAGWVSGARARRTGDPGRRPGGRRRAPGPAAAGR